MYNHHKKALSRIYLQYKNAPKLVEWLGILPAISQSSLEEQITKINNLLDIDNGEGAQLDICGRIVGFTERPLIRNDYLSVFAYNGTGGAQPYNVASYKAPHEQIGKVPVSDYLYRVLIKAKIQKNNSNATLDEIKTAADYILDVSSAVIDGQDMTIKTIWVDKPIPANILVIVHLFDLIPRPQGVNAGQIRLNHHPFAYKGTFDAQPYGNGAYI
ncbi:MULTISPECIES: DUF2612 domain-containing protein [Yersinia pseudotuberculosis complex]|uniref:Protein of uncharacterized function (DUF2612) n=2 Tax=Yersinia pseudotuberculosis complex TaxID=1649845 RepID=A0A0T9PT99_9GAMM|nr:MULTISPECIES: DUF2612 domain-containing protein [Yersinia pseudotuberculosis complex]ABS47936.1 conserved hypothetical protein [Yersinia pseudotuberculosis IP 31758]AJK15398.1 hypothetical protein BZ19_1227 [Yersinia pseudotuberculosis str. PA3606]MCE4114774.1 DUF2612 domain-containing protein [Yersinia pseudotuberculosis]MCF1165371.1 DUF2612 domain-containing protein [Yersinia pseudotuberculosis]RYC28097.1 DUF2612 domain-containing protein [Yersinia pseudotuberculosis]